MKKACSNRSATSGHGLPESGPNQPATRRHRIQSSRKAPNLRPAPTISMTVDPIVHYRDGQGPLLRARNMAETIETRQGNAPAIASLTSYQPFVHEPGGPVFAN